jgi:O-antigen ligase
MKLFNILVAIICFLFFALAFQGRMGLAIRTFEYGFAGLFVYYFFRSGQENARLLISLYVISFPIINVSRGSFFTYNIHSVLLFLVTLKLLKENYAYVKLNYFNKIYGGLLLFGVIYYLSSYYITGKYSSNLRIFELLFTAGLVPFLFEDKKVFNYVIVILIINAIILVQLGSNIDSRLLIGTSEFDEELELGGNNPISYGLPIAFSLLALLSEESFFSALKGTVLRYGLMVFGILSLILTTSRASIMAFIIGILIYYWYKHKLYSLFKIALFSIVFYFGFLYLSQNNKYFTFAYRFLIERTEENQDDLNKISSGRLEQWIAVRDYLYKNPGDMILGYGPGTQFQSFVFISSATENKSKANFVGISFAFHALPLQLVVEIGLIGTIFFYILIFMILTRDFGYIKYGIFPLMAVFVFISIGLSVSSFDVFSGLFLGVSLVPIFSNNINYARFKK